MGIEHTVTIYCTKGSYAYEYAIKKGIKVAEIGGAPEAEVFSFDIYPKSGNGNILLGREENGNGIYDPKTGDGFTFTVVTSSNVNEISVCGDKNDETVWHEIPYQYLVDNYDLTYVDNGDGTKTWTTKIYLNETGYRTFMIKANGQNTDLRAYVTVNAQNTYVGDDEPTELPTQGGGFGDGSDNYEDWGEQQPPVEEYAPITESDTEAPVIYFVDSDDVSQVKRDAPETITIVAQAGDNIEVKTIALYYDGMTMNEEDGAFLSATINTSILHIGQNEIRVVAVDSAGNTTYSDPIYITVTEDSKPDELPELSVQVNGKKVEFDVPPQVINDRTMLPIRAIAETLGASVRWDDSTKTVIITYYNPINGIDKRCSIAIDSQYMYWEETGAWIYGGEVHKVELDSPAVIVDGRTLVPLRAIAEVFGFEVQWDALTRTAIIDDKVPVDDAVEIVIE